MLRKIILGSFIIFISCGVLLAQELKVNNQTINEGDNLNLFYDNLDAGKINFALGSGNLKKAEITFDNGRSWQEMKEEGAYFVYGYRPLSNEVIYPQMLLTDKEQRVQTYRPNLRINYHKEKPDQQIIQVLEKMKIFYENENKEQFLNLFSSRFPNLVKFDQAIQNDFYYYKNIRLFYRIDTRAFDDDLEGAVWYVYWRKNYQNISGVDQPEASANISMRFDKDSGNWQITGLKNNTIFGSSLLVSEPASGPVLEIAAADITKGVGSPYTVNAVVHNTGSTSANNITVNFYRNGAFLSAKTISSIASGSTGLTTCDYSSFGPSPATTVRVDIDPANLITPADPTKKTATKVIDLG